MKIYKYVLFDFDGTIADSKDVFIDVFNQMAEKHNFKKIELEQIDYLRSLPVVERLKILKLPFYKIPILAPELYKLYKQSIAKINIFEGVKKLLEQLKDRKIKLAIISSNSERNIQEVLEHNNINFFDDIMCSNHIFGKDQMINNFLRKNKLSNSEVIYVGDELRDINSCKKANIKVIWVEWGYDVAEVAKQGNPDYIVSEPHQILAVI